jgi:hypothetical protein
MSRPFVSLVALMSVGAFASACVAMDGGSPPPDTTTTTTTTIPFDAFTECIDGQTCEEEFSTPQSSINVDTEVGTDGFISIDVAEGLQELDCTGIVPAVFYLPLNPVTYIVNTTNNAEKRITITIPGAEADGQTLWNLQMCFGAPTPFTSLQSDFPFTGPAELDVDTGEYVGLLPPCLQSFPILEFDPPCVESRSIDEAGTAKITALLPAGDPRTK